MSAIASLMTMSRAGFAFGDFAPRAAVDFHRAEELLGDFVAPVAEAAFRELHDVPLVHERDALSLVLDGVADGRVDQALGAEVADRLDADADFDRPRRASVRRSPRASSATLGDLSFVPKRIFLNSFGKFLREEVENLLRLGRSAGVFDAGVDVFRVLAEDHHVHLLRMLHRRRHAREIPHRPQADVKIEHLPQRDVERANPAADGRGQRALDADQIRLERLDGVIRQPVLGLIETPSAPA